jgi:hypothetical protein
MQRFFFFQICEHRSGVVAGRINETTRPLCTVHCWIDQNKAINQHRPTWLYASTTCMRLQSWMTVDEENVHADVYTVQYWSAGRIDGTPMSVVSSLISYVRMHLSWRPYRMSPRTDVQLVLYGKHDGRMCLFACNCNKQLCISQL